MEQEKQERFQLLLEQIGWKDMVETEIMKAGKIEKLQVYPKERKWHFHFGFPSILPATLFQSFFERLKEEYARIAKKIDITIYPERTDFTEAQLVDYWSIFINYLNGHSDVILRSLMEASPKLEGNKVSLSFANEAEALLCKQKTELQIKHLYQKVGFQSLTFDYQVKENKEEMQAFREHVEKEIQERMIHAKQEFEKQQKEREKYPDGPVQEVRIGYDIRDEAVTIQTIQDEERRVVLEGYIFNSEIRELRSGRVLLTFKMTDYTDSILVKVFSKGKEDIPLLKAVQKGMWVKVRGSVQNDSFARDLVVIANDVNEIKKAKRTDDYEGEKRIELHAHTTMSQMDAIVSPSELIERAADFGHSAVAITDHAVVQSYPEAYQAGQKHGVKVLYGVEMNLVDDGVAIAYQPEHLKLEDATYVVFDVETTGLSVTYDTIIELAGVKVKNGEIIDRYESFANPHRKLSDLIIELTHITDDMLVDAKEAEEVFKEFYEFSKDCILVAHNASFDMGFLDAGYEKIGVGKATNPVIDTLELARFLFPTNKNHRLNTLCKKLDIKLTQHHRAIYDAEATGYLLWKLLEIVKEEHSVEYHDQLNEARGSADYKSGRPSHCTVFAKTPEGLKNLYQLVSKSHVDFYYRVPRMPKSVLDANREGLLIGSACYQGEVFEAIMNKTPEEAKRVAKFYDFLEIQPPEYYHHLIEKEFIRDELALKDMLSMIVKIGEDLNIPVVATGNVHYLDTVDHIYRTILVQSITGPSPLKHITLPKAHYRTTQEMLNIFSFLGEEKAKEVVITNTHLVSGKIEELKPIKEKLYTPHIEGADEEMREMSYTRAKEIYGEELPEIVEKRLEKELKSIIDNGFAVIYLISHKLVKKSLDDGYLVGSRGSVGSSFVATMTDITEVNPLPPHYVCPTCKHSEFFNDGSVGSGYDLPDKKCPKCGDDFKKDGQDIPFETFLGFKGDKVPDIDLNFSGDYQPHAHNYTKVLFGEDYVYRAGTIGTVAEKTAYGYVKGYASKNELMIRNAEVDRLVHGCTGVKRTTGQHPGGIIVVPDYMDIYDFTPIQYPADDTKAEWKTTHFDFHSIHDNILKLDILGHDDPTVIRMLQDLSGINPKTIPVDDQEVMKIFSGTESIGVTPEQIMCKTGTLGIPEFGTRFVRQMLEDTKPSTFSELVQISGLSHGTDVWLNNAADLIQSGTCVLKDVIGCRDDIMVYLIYKGLEPSLAFKIMESVRKGRGLTEEWIEEMKKHDVPDWYIDSCLKIKYMFPKAHAAAYVLMAVRIAYFKVHMPILFYAAYFSVRATDFELDTMAKGSHAIRKRIEEINGKGLEATPKEKSLLTVLEIALEMCERGFSFQKIDLYRSDAHQFIVDGNSLIPPFSAIGGLGKNAAENIVKAREEAPFLSKEDLQKRSKISKTVIEFLDNQGCLADLPDQNQLSLF